jgi:LuxR family transcriptional regulator, maltose regulon positive regulatory protein
MGATSPLLATKLYIPIVRAGHVARPHLRAKLNEGLRRPLTLLSAPAGFGKSTLLAEWIDLHGLDGERSTVRFSAAAQPPAPGAPTFCWLSLDEADNDATRFWSYFVAALQNAWPAVGSDVVLLLQSPQSSQSPPFERLLTLLINELAMQATELVMVLDDYHLIDNPTIHTALTFLIDHLPPLIHLVIATRADPPLPLARWRVRGQLSEIRAADLRFSLQETAAFFQAGVGVELPHDTVAALEARTEGWIAGLQLAALSMHGRTDLAGFVTSFAGSHRYIMDYLVEEVLQSQPADVQHFLLQTSILDRLCAALCDAVIGDQRAQSLPPTPYSQVMLDRLLRANLFLIPLDDEQRWFRYHHLFADVLRQRLAGAQAAALHLRASYWFEQNELAAEAIQHALAGSAFERAAHLIESTALSTVQRGQVLTVQGWLQALPASVRETRPRLFLAAAQAALGMGQAPQAAALLDAAEGLLAGQPAATAVAIAGEIAASRALHATFHQQHPRAIGYARLALDQLPADQFRLRAAVAAGLGFAQLLAGEVAAAEQTLTKTLSALPADADLLILRMTLMGTLGMVRSGQGRLRAALQLQREAYGLLGRDGRSLPLAISALVAHELGRLLYDCNELDESEHFLHQALEASRPTGDTAQLAFVLRLLAQVRQARGELEQALSLLDESEAIFHAYPVAYSDAAVNPARVHIWVQQGNLEQAIAWADAQSLAQFDERPLHPFDWTRFALAEVWLLQHKFDAVHALMDDLLVRSEAAGMGSFVLWALAIKGVTHHLERNSEAACPTIERALRMAAQEGYIRLFVELGEPMHELIAEWRVQRAPRSAEPHLRAFSEQLLAAFGPNRGIDHDAPIGMPHPPLQNLIAPLSTRELEVLSLMAAGHSNQQIAGQLVVTVGTVKKHLNNIFGKLGVVSRTQALVKAQALDLLQR